MCETARCGRHYPSGVVGFRTPFKKTPTVKHKPWYEKGLRFECTTCGACCRSHGDYAHLYMVEEEVLGIAQHLGLDPQTFRERYCAEEDGWTVLQEGHEVCPFLGEDNRCQVYPVRPMQCRSWPFWEENLASREVWEGDVKATCPGIGQGQRFTREEVEDIARRNEEWYEG